MRELLAVLDAWRAEGRDVSRAVVVRTFGSAPRLPGAVLLRTDDGRIAGSVSGGCVEGAVADELERARATGRSRVLRYGISDETAWGVGLACGGTIDVLVEPWVPEPVVEAARAAGDRRSGGRVVATTLPDDAPPSGSGPFEPGAGASPEPPVVVAADGRVDGTLGSPEADRELALAAVAALARGGAEVAQVAGRARFLETYPLRPRIVIVGAVPVAAALARIAQGLDHEVVVVDGRPAFSTRERLPDVDRIIVGWLDEVADDISLGEADAVVVLSHDPKLDDPAIVEALRRGCRYVGAIGSRTTQAARHERLVGAGVPDADLARLRGPIGLDLGGRSPAETALAIMAEIVAARHGASGAPMVARTSRGPGSDRSRPRGDRLAPSAVLPRRRPEGVR